MLGRGGDGGFRVLLQAVMKNPLPTRYNRRKLGRQPCGGAHNGIFPVSLFLYAAFALAGGMLAFILVYGLSYQNGLSP